MNVDLRMRIAAKRYELGGRKAHADNLRAAYILHWNAWALADPDAPLTAAERKRIATQSRLLTRLLRRKVAARKAAHAAWANYLANGRYERHAYRRYLAAKALEPGTSGGIGSARVWAQVVRAGYGRTDAARASLAAKAAHNRVSGRPDYR